MPHATSTLEAPPHGIGTRIAQTRTGERLMRPALLLGILLTVAPLSGSEPLTLRVSPMQSFAPANLYIRLSIEPHANNRVVTVVAESEGYYRSSDVALEGEDGPRTVTVQFRSVPEGRYEIRGAVGDAQGREVSSVRQNVFVLSGNGR